MKAAGGQARESRDDIGIGSVRQPGERGTAIDKVPACCLLPVTTHDTEPPHRQLPLPYQRWPR
jgi:hypothetical protein